MAETPRLVIIFVHGFDGDSRKTWLDFQVLVDAFEDRYPLWSECDLYFYSYDSFQQVIPQGEELLPFVRDVALGAGTLLPGPFALPSSLGLGGQPASRGPYQKLVLVGHSTGGVIIREAILQRLGPLASSEGLEKKKPTDSRNPEHQFNSLLLDCALRLFAPANLGAICAGSLGLIRGIPGISRLLNLRLQYSPLFQNIVPGSPVLNRIQRETESLQQKFPGIDALTADCLFGKNEAVVIVGGYAHDKLQPTVPEQDHLSICKPRCEYLEPLEFVIDELLRKAAS